MEDNNNNNNAVAAENNDADPPQQQQQPLAQREPSHFDRELERLGRNSDNVFNLASAVERGRDEKLTIAQARSLSCALMRSTSVGRFVFHLNICSLSAIRLFLDYIRTSPYLKDLCAKYDTRPSDSEEMQRSYKRQMDLLCQAVQENDSIHKLTLHMSRGFLINSSPKAIYNLLSNNRSLTDFRISGGCRLDEEMALSIAAGLSKSPICNIQLCVARGPLDIVISGLVGGPVESLHIYHANPDAALWEAVSRLMLFSSSLKHLKIDECPFTGDYGLARIFSVLCHPACTGLHSLHLEDASLAVETNSSDGGGVPIDQANATLHTLRLVDVTFETPHAVRLLWNAVGIRDLSITCPTTCLANEQIDPDDCAEFIRRNTSLTTLKLCVRSDDEHPIFRGVLEGAKSLTALTTLSIETVETAYPEDDVPVPLTGALGGLLRRILEQAPSLTQLSFERVNLGLECITLLASGLSYAHALRVLHFTSCSMVARGVTVLAGSLLVNETLHDLTFTYLEIPELLGTAFCQTVSQVFHINKSLTKLGISKVDLRDGALSEMLLGLGGNNVMKSLVLTECPLDNAAMTALGQVLESPTTSVLSEIGLPRNYTSSSQMDNVEEGTRAFLTGLAHMPNVQKVHFGSTIPQLDDASRRLLLRAAKQNKNICILSDYSNSIPAAGSEDDDDPSAAAAMELSEIEYYLKLNRFGRRLLDSTNILPSLWPRILSRMTGQPKDVDALFFFLREYFSRQSTKPDDGNDDDGDDDDDDPSHHHHHQQQQQPPQKKARVA